MDWLWIVVGIILSITGILGALLPVLPGPRLITVHWYYCILRGSIIIAGLFLSPG